MLDTEIRVAMRSGLTEGTPLMSISPSPRVSESCFCVPFLMMLLTSLIGSTAVFLAPGDELVTVIYPIVEKGELTAFRHDRSTCRQPPRASRARGGAS